MPRRPLISALVLLWGVAAASAAWSLGFGAAPQSTVLGAALDLAIPLRLEDGESIAAGCVSAEVHIGERQLPKADVRIHLSGQGGQQVLRVRAAQSVNEPVVSVLLRVGCPTPMQRSFVVLADPQPMAPSTAPSAAAPVPMAPPPAKAVADAAPAAAALAPRAKPAVRARIEKSALAVTAVTARRGSDRPKKAPRGTPPAARLQLEAAEPGVAASTATAEAARAAEEGRTALLAATSAALAAQQAASAASLQLAALSVELQRLRDEQAAQQATTLQLRERLTAAQQPTALMQALAGLLALLGAATAWLAWRLRAARSERQAAWHRLAAQAQTSTVQPVDTMPGANEPAARAAVQLPSGSGMSHGVDNAAALDLQPLRLIEDQPAERAVAVEDLIDLEQQAEFFVMLGQDEAAIDLLVGHLRDTGGTSPLPYLKLLEIYKRLAQREAYERTRGRFNRRFNAYAPEWEASLDQGSSLLEYPLVTATLQAAWTTPLDAMAELQTLLFRKNEADLFDLPAYHDLLVLYAVARDLHSLGEDTPTGVDVLLPLPPGPDEPRLTETLISSFGAFDTGVFDDRPTAPVDLDLNDSALFLDSRPTAVQRVSVALSGN